MKVKVLRTLILTLMAGAMLTGCSDKSGKEEAKNADGMPQDVIEVMGREARTPSGDFLSSHFAQSQYDWETANGFLDRVLKGDMGNADLLKRSMILAVGSGDMKRAAERAQTVLKAEPKNGLALLVLSVNALAQNDAAQAETYLKIMPDGDLTSFIKPLVYGWVKAGQGKLDTAGFNDTTIHLYHGACMALMLNQPEKAKQFTKRIIESGGLGTYDAERAGDLLAALGENDDALAVYNGVLTQTGKNMALIKKIDALKKNDGSIKPMLMPLQIKTPVEGAALAMYDMAFVLYQEYSDTSAKIFAEMALALKPDMIDAKLLLGDTLARNGRYDEAIQYFKDVPKDNPSYMASQRHAAELLAEAGRHGEAKALLNRLFIDNNDVESLIRIGDLYRQEEDYSGALKIYNKAATHIGGKVPEEYWYLLYARGMAYEREGDWRKAEADLKDALSYRPDNPYLMNYLGYGWADQGVNLDQSLQMIQRAVTLKPTDGYITDSLGWVMYMMGRYDESIPHLERAVELLPYDATINDHLGDAYWRVGRELEAKFQWERARNNAGPDDAALKEAIAVKLKDGLGAPGKVKAANAAPPSGPGLGEEEKMKAEPVTR